MKDETLKDAFQNWEALSGTAEQMLAYEGRMKHILDEEAAVIEAELRVEEGKKEGKMEGVKEGIEVGAQAEREKIAHRLLVAGMTIEAVVLATELTKEEVCEIKSKL